eukprot:2866242-Karenia_brevis.AAC.1
MKQHLCKCGALSTPCDDAICWFCYPRVELVASNAPTCRMHVEPQLQHQWWIPQSNCFCDKCWDGYVV